MLWKLEYVIVKNSVYSLYWKQKCLSKVNGWSGISQKHPIQHLNLSFPGTLTCPPPYFGYVKIMRCNIWPTSQNQYSKTASCCKQRIWIFHCNIQVNHRAVKCLCPLREWPGFVVDLNLKRVGNAETVLLSILQQKYIFIWVNAWKSRGAHRHVHSQRQEKKKCWVRQRGSKHEGKWCKEACIRSSSVVCLLGEEINRKREGGKASNRESGRASNQD